MKKKSGTCSFHSADPLALVRYALTVILFAALGACVSVPPAQQLIGHWRGELKGFPLLIVYTEQTVSVDGSDPVPYEVSGDLVTLPEQDNRSYRIEFPSTGVMAQVDESTGARQLFSRIK